MTPSFSSLTDTKQSLQYTIKTHLSSPPMPKFEANMNYIPPSPPSSMKQCNKSTTVKFHMELLLTRKQSRSGATPSESAFPRYNGNNRDITVERNKFYEKIKDRLCLTNKCGRTRQRTNNLRDELIWGMNSASELVTVYYYTCRSIRR